MKELQNMDVLWKTVLDELQLEVSKPNFLTFFKNTSLESLENSVATISAKTPIASEHIEKRYYSLIKRVLDKKTEQNISLVFVSSSNGDLGKKGALGPLFIENVKKRQSSGSARLRKDYTFEEFAVSESNRLGYTAALTVASDPGSKYNPLFLYGTVGVGKTHLMHAIAHAIIEKNEEKHVVYLTSEEFTNEVVEAIRDKTTTQLRRKFRNVDLLLLDDIQFVGGKERVQEELFHTFNSLIDKGRQIVFTSDKPPSEIKRLEARLESRFESGLTVDIQSPDFELRTAILLKKSEKRGLSLSLPLAQLISENITDTRALEGFILRIVSEIPSSDSVSAVLVERLLKNKKKEDSLIIRPDSVISVLCSYYGIKTTQLKGGRRDASIVLPRHICMYLLKEEAGLSYVEVGNLLGGRDHTTVMYGVEKIRTLLSSSSSRLSEEILFIKQRISGGFLQ